MKRLGCFLAALLWICLLAVPVSAASQVDSMDTGAVVSTDGAVRLTLRLQLRLDTATEDLTFPLPGNAKAVRLDGRFAGTISQNGFLLVRLPDMSAGVRTLEISYELPPVLTKKAGLLFLDLPLLSGFSLPVEKLSFSVTLPEAVQEQPSFTTTYNVSLLGDGIEATTQGNVISGYTTKALMDRDSLSLRLKTVPSVFPDYSDEQPLLGLWEAVIAVLAAVAVLYYLIALLPIIPKKIHCFSAPEGIAAGELGTCLTGCGIDLTMMVFTWAQLGYLVIEMDEKGDVTLQKRMEMGNERSSFEIRCFDNLFGNRTSVDGESLHYARLCRKLARKSALRRQLYKSSSGNPWIFRVLAVAAGAFGGIELGLGIYSAGAGTVFLLLGMFLLCGSLSYVIQSGGCSLPLGNKTPIYLAVGGAGLWIGLGVLMGDPTLAAILVGFEILAGLAAAMGGRRSELGQRCVAQIRGLRHHLLRASIFDMQQYLQKNPNYFFEMMPYALALGVEKPFARRFGKTKLTECSYLTVPIRRELTAAQWGALLRQAANRLNHRQKRLQYEQLMNQLREHTKRK